MTYIVKFYRSNPQLINGGYETTRKIEARTKNALQKKIKQIENAPGYGGMTFIDIVGEE